MQCRSRERRGPWQFCGRWRRFTPVGNLCPEEGALCTDVASVPQLTAVVVNYNGIATVCETIGSLLESRSVDVRIVVIDDGSTDGSPEAIRRWFPQVTVEAEPRNTREVNRLRNKGLALANSGKIFLTDNDVKFHPDCLSELLRVMEGDDRVGVCVPRLMYRDDPERVYQSGGHVHYVGATIAPGRDAKATAPWTAGPPEPATGGGIALFDGEKLRQVGGFDENYALAWGDDGELHHRLRLAGYKSLYVPSAVGFHEFKSFTRSRHYRARGQIQNRWRFLLTHYSARTLALITPALLLFELMQASFFLMKGLPHLYIQGTLAAIRALPGSLRRRGEIQALRRVPDKELLQAGPIYIRPEHGLQGRAVALAVGAIVHLLSLHWRLIRPLLASSAKPAGQRAFTKATR